MASKLKQFTFRGRGRQASRHPWDEWLNGDIWKLVKGTDFSCRVESFRSMAYAAAHYRGLKFQSQIDGDTIVIRALEKAPA